MNKSIIIAVASIVLTTASAEVKAQRFLRRNADNGDPIVEDKTTGLVWQGCSAGRDGAGCENRTGTATEFDWDSALAYCEDSEWGGVHDWRLPNINELRSIVDNRRADPSVDKEAFPRTQSAVFWTSTTNADREFRSTAWTVDFDNGDARYDRKTESDNTAVRCVRGGQETRP